MENPRCARSQRRAGTPLETESHCSTRVYQYLVPRLAYKPQECGVALGKSVPPIDVRAFLGAVCQSEYSVLLYPRTAVGRRGMPGWSLRAHTLATCLASAADRPYGMGYLIDWVGWVFRYVFAPFWQADHRPEARRRADETTTLTPR